MRHKYRLLNKEEVDLVSSKDLKEVIKDGIAVAICIAIFYCNKNHSMYSDMSKIKEIISKIVEYVTISGIGVHSLGIFMDVEDFINATDEEHPYTRLWNGKEIDKMVKEKHSQGKKR